MNFDFKFINFGILIFSAWKFSGHEFHVKNCRAKTFHINNCKCMYRNIGRKSYICERNQDFFLCWFLNQTYFETAQVVLVSEHLCSTFFFFCLSIQQKLRKRFQIINLKYFLESKWVLNFITLFVTICNILESKLILKYAHLFLFISHLLKQLIILIHFLIIWN